MEELPEPADGPVEPPPTELMGYRDLRRWLRGIGIVISQAMLDEKVRSVEFAEAPVQRWGRRARFTADQLKEWVLLLTKYSYEDWMRRWDAADQSRRFLYSREKKKPEEKDSLCYGLATGGETEELLRATSGEPFLTHDRGVMRRWSDPARDLATALFMLSVTRTTTDADWAIPGDGVIRALVAPRVMRHGELYYVDAKGNLFGLPESTSTPLVAQPSWRYWKSLRPKIDRQWPDALWTTWTERTDLDKYLMTPVLVRRG